MSAHFADVLALLDAVIVGGVADVRSVGAAFVDRNHGRALAPGWAPRVDAMLAYAADAADAPDIDTAAYAVARLSVQCGQCHRAEGVKLPYRQGLQPHRIDQMKRYRFAVDRMWEGLVGPSTQRWTTGAELYATTVTCSAPQGSPQAQSHHREPCNSVLAIAGSARTAKTDEARAEVFAAVARSCAGCHTVPRYGSEVAGNDAAPAFRRRPGLRLSDLSSATARHRRTQGTLGSRRPRRG